MIPIKLMMRLDDEGKSYWIGDLITTAKEYGERRFDVVSVDDHWLRLQHYGTDHRININLQHVVQFSIYLENEDTI